MIVIVDYGMGNLGSIVNMIKKVGSQAVISSDPEQIRQAPKIILPGVGAFDTGMRRLNELGLVDVLNEKVLVEKTPTIGVCLGMQLLAKGSEEGVLPGLGWIDADVVRFRFEGNQLRIPHMGWNTVNIQHEECLFRGLNNESRFYFVHSYHMVCHNTEDILTTTPYGYDFVSSVERGNIYGAQFHPEKSHKFGMRLLKNFVEL
jgi:imidazole glycerol-phosphate synthase subunit HisH